MRNTLTVSTLHINFILNFYINRKRQEDWATLVNHCCWPLGPDKFPSPSRDNTINHPHKLFIWRKLYKIADGQQQASWTFYYSEVFIWRKNIVAGCWWKCWNTTRGGDNNSSTDINYMEQGPTSRHYILHPHTHTPTPLTSRAWKEGYPVLVGPKKIRPLWPLCPNVMSTYHLLKPV